MGAGIAAHSLTLIAFGIDSVIELASAVVFVWRLTVELKHSEEFSLSAEKRARQIASVLLFVLAAYVLFSAGWSLWHRQGAEFSVAGLVVALIALPLMLGLYRGKLHLAAMLRSRALRADAIESIACAWLSLVVVVGLIAQTGSRRLVGGRA